MPRRAKRLSKQWAVLIGLTAAVFGGFLVVGPAVKQWQESHDPAAQWRSDPTLYERSLEDFLQVFVAGWIFSVGACIGSFINVVAYRVPRRISLYREGSRCPHCLVPIRASDNVPILGWLRLGGRCRACHLPISARYPLVELAVALIFLSLAYVELLSAGANLPGGKRHAYTGATWILWFTKWDMVGLYAYHCGLLSTLVTWSLIQLDRQRVPRAFAGFAIGLALLFPAIWPDLHPVAWREAPQKAISPALQPAKAVPWASGVSTGAIGAAAGGLVGLALSAIARRFRGEEGGEVDGANRIFGMMFIGASLGWQMLVGCALLAALTYGAHALLLRGLASRTEPPFLAYLTASCWLLLCLWRLTATRLPFWPGPQTSYLVMALDCFACFAMWAFFNALLARKRDANL
ncbi:MAG TPA: prepilin peptidase [Pirellulales bacterium]|nr:prepilin peptidase [Pirellulales bacterium]